MSGVIESIKQEAQTTGMQVTPQMVLGRVQQVLPQIQSEMKDLVYEKARKLAEDITQEIDDKLTEGGWYSALKTCLPNVVLHTGFLCGPTSKKRPSIKIKPMPDGKLVAHIIDEVIPTWESRHPLNLYPSPDSTNINDGYLFDRFKLTPKALQELIGVPSYDEDEIREVLDEICEGKLDNWLSVDQEKATIDDSPSPLSYDSKKIEALKFFGAVKGSDILEWGKIKGPDNEKLDKTLYYDICAYKIGSHVISIQYNKDPLGRKPYYKASFEEVDGSFWGKGLPQIIRDVQGVCNAMARAIVNNAGMGSGPQVERNIDRIPSSERAENKLIPWKVWDVTNDMMAGSAPALKFYQPPMVVERLMNVYQAFSKIADEHSGVPAFTHGDPNVSGAGNTASGLSMLMGSAARGIKSIIKSIDEHIIKPSVERQYIWLIERKDYFGMVCDYQIVSGGTMAALAREQMAARRIEFMNSTANPVDAQIMGMEGRKYVLEETAKSVNLELSRMMPKNPPQPPAEKPKPPSESISFKDLPPEGQVQMAAHAGIQLSSASPPTAIPQGPSGGAPSGPSFGPTGASARTLDHAGNPVVGQDVRQFNAPGRAEGGPVVAGQPYTVGEYGPEYLAQIMGAGIVGQNGPEIIIPKADGMIIPQTKTSDYITVQDTTPRAIETNNLTIKKAPVDLIIKIATEAKKQGVDPNAALAVAWKETGLGTLSFPGHEPSLRIQNPMQFEATLRDKGTANAFEKKVQEAIKQDPGYKDIASMKIPTPEDWMFRRARLNFLESTQWQKALIEAGVSYLGDLYDKKGTLEAAFAKYRGTGKAAKYHGKHVMELYESIKSNPEIQNLIEGINIE